MPIPPYSLTGNYLGSDGNQFFSNCRTLMSTLQQGGMLTVSQRHSCRSGLTDLTGPGQVEWIPGQAMTSSRSSYLDHGRGRTRSSWITDGVMTIAGARAMDAL